MRIKCIKVHAFAYINAFFCTYCPVVLIYRKQNARIYGVECIFWEFPVVNLQGHRSAFALLTAKIDVS